MLSVLVCLAAAGLTIPAAAAAKVTKLRTCVEHIAAPGTYRLTANLVAKEDCFFLDGNGVTLDLNGHTITAAKGTVGIRAAGLGDKIVGPGTIAGFEVGISLVDHGRDTVRGVTAIANRIGIVVNSGGNTVRGNVTTNNQLSGIDVYLGAPHPSAGNRIIGNFAHSNGESKDLRDNNPNCLFTAGNRNVWRDNDFGTANQSCIL